MDERLPLWRCHKTVGAAKIDVIDRKPDGSAILHLSADGRKLESIRVNHQWMEKHEPYVGGYLVQYEDGYRSFSPAPAFESGYTRIEAPA